MANRFQAGQLRERVALLMAPVPTDDDGGGGYGSEPVEQFRCHAGYKQLRGGESVVAARLEGLSSQIVRIRQTPQSREVDTGWTLKDLATGEVMNIRDVQHTVDRRWTDLLCQAGVAI